MILGYGGEKWDYFSHFFPLSAHQAAVENPLHGLNSTKPQCSKKKPWYLIAGCKMVTAEQRGIHQAIRRLLQEFAGDLDISISVQWHFSGLQWHFSAWGEVCPCLESQHEAYASLKSHSPRTLCFECLSGSWGLHEGAWLRTCTTPPVSVSSYLSIAKIAPSPVSCSSPEQFSSELPAERIPQGNGTFPQCPLTSPCIWSKRNRKKM